jgi:hypothetical protein
MNPPTQCFYRAPWTQNKVEWLVQWWPHFGTFACAEQLDLTGAQVKAKVDKLRLQLLPKAERLCVECREHHQVSRRYGLQCRPCALDHRRDTRRDYVREPSLWFREVARTARHRSKETSDITAAYLAELWQLQDGRCEYSGLLLNVPQYGAGRRWDVASLDRINPARGYMQGNVVWCLWACNAGKSSFTPDQYVDICRRVVAHADRKALALLVELDTENPAKRET